MATQDNSGLGIETTRALAYAGAKVIFTSRDITAGEKAAAELQAAGLKVLTATQRVPLAILC